MTTTNSTSRETPIYKEFHWWRYGDSNPGPLACHASALPAELYPRRNNDASRRTLGLDNAATRVDRSNYRSTRERGVRSQLAPVISAVVDRPLSAREWSGGARVKGGGDRRGRRSSTALTHTSTAIAPGAMALTDSCCQANLTT